MTASILFKEIINDLDLQGLDLIKNKVILLQTLVAAKPKKAAPKNKVKQRGLILEITEAGKTTTVTFQTEKEGEAFLKLKQKQRHTTAKSPEGLAIPEWQEYKKIAEYWQASKAQNLDFTVKITSF
jgi:hypothetical protein